MTKLRETYEGRELVNRVITIATAELGQCEWLKQTKKKKPVRKGENPRIGDYHAATRGGRASESVYWCASYACWVLERAGIYSPRSKAAIAFEDWGAPVPFELYESSGPVLNVQAFEVGQVCVFKRDDPGNPDARHVGLLLGLDREDLLVISGNDRDAVRKSWRKAADLTAVRTYGTAQLIQPGQEILK